MIKKYLLILIASLCFIVSGFGQMTDLIISEYVEGSSSNKYIEIYNGTGSNVNLSDYQILLFSNGNSAPNNTNTLSGILADGAVVVYSNSSASIYTGTTTNLSAIGFNGDDAIALYKISTTSYVDIFGRIGNDPGSSWTSGSHNTINKTLVRKPSVCGGVTVSPTGTGSGAFTTLSSEWDVFNQNDISNLGSHTESCSTSDPDLSITGITDHGSVCEMTSAATITYTITNNGTLSAAGITVVSDNAEFVVSNLSSTSIAASGTATYDVTFTPSSTGNLTATITISSTTVTSNSPTSSLIGTGIAITSQVVTSNAATLIEGTTATINGNVNTLGTCPNTIEKGFVYSQTSINSNPLYGGANVTEALVAGLSTGTYNLGLIGLSTGTEYSFRTYVYNGATYSYGNVLTFTTTSPPINDLCSGAIDITPTSSTCSFGSYTNVSATDSGETASSCNGYSGGDVWFSAVVPLGGELNIETSANGGFSDGVMALYSGSCGALTEIACDDDSGTGSMSLINATGLTPGSTVYIRVWEYNNNSFGTFDICVTRPETTVEFESATYSVSEGGNSINLCVDIFNPSASAPTVVEVGLSSSSSPHLSFTTTTLTFPAGSTGQQCFPIPIMENSFCGDSKNYAFEFLSITGGNSVMPGTIDTTILTVLDNEGTAGTIKSLAFESGDDWGYSGGGAVNSTANKYNGTSSYRLSGSSNIITDNFDISTYTNVKLNVAFASRYCDSGDDLFLDISYDGGTNWNGTGSIKLVDGYSNASLDIGDTNASNPTTVATNPWLVSIPDSETQIKVRLRVTSLGSGEYYYVDDIILTGDSCPACTSTHTVTNFVPTSGPIGTEVTINGTNLGGVIVNFDGNSAIIVSQTSTQVVVVVPTGTITGAITIDESGCTSDTTTDFTIINTSGPCNGLDDLIMTEIYDSSSGSLAYIEVYNGTGNIVDLTNYYIRRYGDNDRFINDVYTDYSFAPNITSIANGAVIYGKISTNSDTASPDFDYIGSASGGINDEDIFHLRKGSEIIDVYIEPNGDVGYTARRNTNTTGPNNTSNPSDWTQLSPENETNLGVFNFSGTISSFPTVSASPMDVVGCVNEAVFVATGLPGNSGSLTYQWYFNDGIASTWTLVNTGNLPLATVSIVSVGNMSTLTLSGDYFNYAGYQFYCLITETGTCDVASDAAQLKIEKAIWTSSGWSSSPTLDKVAILDYNYDTSNGTNGQSSFDACSLIINPDKTLVVKSNDYVNVNFNVTNNGTFMIENNGSLVQIDDTGVNTGNINMERKASVDNLDYVYWSSPVSNFDVNNISTTQYIYKWNPTFNNTNGTQGNWIPDNGNMEKGVGYIVRGYGSQAAPINPGDLNFTVDFVGVPFNGLIPVAVSRGIDKDSVDDNWNLIGNPYPSAVDVFLFLDHLPNKNVLDGFVHFWTHGNDPIYAPDPFYYDFGSNYTATDYIAYNAVGAGNGPGNISIAAGQSFMVNMLNGTNSTDDSASTNIEFNNSMRNKAFDNSQFYRTTETNYHTAEKHRIWLDLVSEAYGTNRILVGYVEGATMEHDRMYDAITSVSSNQSLYSIIDETPFIIQGRSLPFNDTDAIPLGVNIVEQGNYHIAIAYIDGLFETDSQIIYLKDNALGFIHNLNEAPYSFASATGNFNDRFELVFRDSFLSINEEELTSNNLTIIEHNNGQVQFIVPNQYEIKKIEIIDLLGRTIYNLNGNSYSETYNLSNLSQATYIAKITLSNGQVISKKGMKRK